MSFTPPLFKNLGKSLNDLFKKKFGDKKDFKVNSSASGVSFESTLSFNADNTLGGNLKLKETIKDVAKVEAELNTDGTIKGSSEFTNLSDGLTVKLSAQQEFAGKVEADYTKGSVAVSTVVNASSKSKSVSASGVVGFDGFSVGMTGEYDVSSQAVSDYNAAIEYSTSDFTSTIKTEDQTDKVVASYIHSVKSDLSVGGRFTYNFASKERDFTVGAAWDVDNNTAFKVKANTFGKVEAALEQTLQNPCVTYTLGTKYDLTSKSTVPDAFGLSIVFGN